MEDVWGSACDTIRFSLQSTCMEIAPYRAGTTPVSVADQARNRSRMVAEYPFRLTKDRKRSTAKEALKIAVELLEEFVHIEHVSGVDSWSRIDIMPFAERCIRHGGLVAELDVIPG